MLEDSKTLSSTHKIKLHDIPWLFLSKVTIEDVDYENKKIDEIKDAYPKKVFEHVKKKKKKMHTQRMYATCPKGMSKEKREKICILNEGMPHAHKACHKKKER